MPNEPEHPRRVQLRRTIHKNRVAAGADMAGVVALEWISRRDNPNNPPSRMLDQEYISENQVRELAHDVIGRASAALSLAQKEI